MKRTKTEDYSTTKEEEKLLSTQRIDKSNKVMTARNARTGCVILLV